MAELKINPLDQPGVMFELELTEPNATSKRDKNGSHYWVRFRVSEEAFLAFMQAREGNPRILARCAVVPDTDEQPAHDAVAGKKAARAKQQPADSRPLEEQISGKAWSLLIHKRGFCRAPGVWEAIGEAANGPDDHEHMRGYFCTEHLAEIGEERALQAFTHPTAQTMIRQAWADARRYQVVQKGEAA